MIKRLFIPVAAFAITATSAAAFSSVDWSKLNGVDLSDSEITALEDAQEIRQVAESEARAVLEEAGIDDSRRREINQARHDARRAEHEAMETALQNSDYDAFVEAIADTPLAEVITSKEDFTRFLEAHSLRQSGETEAADAIFSALGLDKPMMGAGRGGHGFGERGHFGDRHENGDE